MNPATPLPSVFDTQSLSGLKNGLRTDDPQALKAAAQQFEAVFLQMVLKSMRDATPQNSMFDSDQSRFYQELLDSQLAQVMAAQGGTGLAKVIEQQLSRTSQSGLSGDEEAFPLLPAQPALPLERLRRDLPLPTETGLLPMPLKNSPVRSSLQDQADGAVSDRPAGFVAALWPYAASASRMTGIPAQFLIAHAALESGWGRSEPRFPDGKNSHNLFGIKAGSHWTGAVVDATTTEYVGGVAQQRIERFRAYSSYAEAFDDYAQLLNRSPRYAGVLASQGAAGFAQELQRAGYATDPAYATKLESIINGSALRRALFG